MYTSTPLINIFFKDKSQKHGLKSLVLLTSQTTLSDQRAGNL